MQESCAHERWQYCRRILQNSTHHFGIQCLDCLSIIKLDRHVGKLWIKPEDIPSNAPIHAWIDPDAVSGKGGLSHG